MAPCIEKFELGCATGFACKSRVQEYELDFANDRLICLLLGWHANLLYGKQSLIDVQHSFIFFLMMLAPGSQITTYYMQIFT